MRIMSKTNTRTLSGAILLLTAMLALGSCSIEREEVSGSAVPLTFRTVSDAATKATAVDPGEEIPALQVYAFGYPETEDLFFHDRFVRQSDGSYASETNTYFWPKGASLTFLAYNETGSTAAGFDELLGGVVSLNSLSTTTIDGITIPSDATLQKDLMQAKTGVLHETSGQVTLEMKHSFSQIRVKARCSNSNITVEVAGVKICGLYSKSTSLSWPPPDVWGSTSSDASYIYKVADVIQAGGATSGTITLTEADQDLMSGESFMLIPQKRTEKWEPTTDKTNSAGGAYLAILCRITQKAGDGVDPYQLFPPEKGKFGFAAVPVRMGTGANQPQNVWTQSGRTYTYSVEFFAAGGGGAGLTDPSPTDPTKPVGGQDPGVDTGTGTGGEPIVGGPLSLSVSVSGWGSGSTHDKPLE